MSAMQIFTSAIFGSNRVDMRRMICENPALVMNTLMSDRHFWGHYHTRHLPFLNKSQTKPKSASRMARAVATSTGSGSGEPDPPDPDPDPERPRVALGINLHTTPAGPPPTR